MKHVSMKYIGQPLGNSQDPDEPYDKTQGAFTNEGGKIGGKGSQGGGSQPQGPTSRGSARNTGSYPRNPQKLRG